MKNISISIIALFIVTSVNAQVIEPEHVQTINGLWDERPRPSLNFFHDMKVGPENVYIAFENGIYTVNKASRDFSFISGTENLVLNNKQKNTLTTLSNGDIIIENQEQIVQISNKNIITLQNYFESLDNPLERILSLGEIISNNLSQTYLTAAYPLEGARTVGIYKRAETGVIELYAGGGSQEIGNEPVHRLDVDLDFFIDDLYLFDDDTIVFAWDERTEDHNLLNNMAIISPDGIVSEYIKYFNEYKGRTFVSKNNLFIDGGSREDNNGNSTLRILQLIKPDSSEKVDISIIPGLVRRMHMDYSETDDALYILAQEIDNFVLWKVPNVLETLRDKNMITPTQSSTSGWEYYE